MDKIFMYVCGILLIFGVSGMCQDPPMWAPACVGVGIGWVFGTLNSINNRLLK